MTREEAIKVLNSYCSERYLADTSLQEACSVAVEALQAQAEKPNDMPWYLKIFDMEQIKRGLQAQADGDNVFKMRDATPEERESIDKYIKSISKPTGIEFDEEQEPKTGHWIYDRTRDWDGECKYECSECGMGSDVDYDYCMRCGAKMIEPQEGAKNEMSKL